MTEATTAQKTGLWEALLPVMLPPEDVDPIPFTEYCAQDLWYEMQKLLRPALEDGRAYVVQATPMVRVLPGDSHYPDYLGRSDSETLRLRVALTLLNPYTAGIGEFVHESALKSHVPGPMYLPGEVGQPMRRFDRVDQPFPGWVRVS